MRKVKKNLISDCVKGECPMPTFPGKLLNNKGSIVAETDVYIEVIYERTGGLYDWHGECELPKDHKIRIDDSMLRLELNDGRCGDVNVTNLNIGYLRFQGTGDLK